MSSTPSSSSQIDQLKLDQKIVSGAKLIKRLGHSNENRVYKAVCDYGTFIAVKIRSFLFDHGGNRCNPSVMEDVKRQAIHEATTHLQMKDENIIQMHHHYQSQGCVVMHMEYFDGEELEAFIVSKATSLEEEDARLIFAQLTAAVRHIHGKGVVHGDLHMGNVMINEKKELKVIDFGNALSAEKAIDMESMDTFWLEKIEEMLLFKLDYPTRVGEFFPDLLSWAINPV